MIRRTPYRGTPKHNISTKNHSQRNFLRKLSLPEELPAQANEIAHKNPRKLFIKSSVVFNSLSVLFFATTVNAAAFPVPIVEMPVHKPPAAHAPKVMVQVEQPAVVVPPPPPIEPPAPPPPPPIEPVAPPPPAPIASAPGANYPWANVSYYVDSSDPWGMFKRQCTSYAAWKVASSNRPMPNWGGHGNATLWDSNARADGIPVDSVPRVGDIAVSHRGTYGHVMYVEAVNGDGTLNISQYNADNAGSYSESVVSASGLDFIHF